MSEDKIIEFLDKLIIIGAIVGVALGIANIILNLMEG